MNEKLSFQNITETLAQKAGVQKKVSETFTKAFFDTIVEALYMGEDIIKVKGLGTFKLVEVESRESVNVSNGERIVIPGYKKVSFTPEDSVVEFLNIKDAIDEQQIIEGIEEKDNSEILETADETENTNVVDDETSPILEIEKKPEDAEVTVEQPEVAVADAPINIDDILQADVPEHVETPQDEFAGIDMLISTPESIDEVRQQLADATAKMDEAVETARKAVEDKMRLQKLLERLEANALPESVEIGNTSEDDNLSETEDSVEELQHSNASEEQDVPEETPVDTPNCDEAEKRNHAFERIMQEPKRDESNDTIVRKKRKGGIWIIISIILLLAVIVFFLYRTFISIDAVKDVAPVHETTPKKVEHTKVKPAKEPANQSDSTKVAESPKDTTKILTATSDASQQPSADERPSVYIMKKGESLTRISQRFYGTKDSVRAIIRANDFIDPDNVPIGAKIRLP